MSETKEKIKDILAVVIVWLMMQWDDIKDMVVTVAVSFFAMLIVANFIFKPVRVDGTSMYPQIRDRSIGFSSIIAEKLGGIDRFDIVIIHPDDRENELIKRVIGLPGETIEYSDGILYVNGVKYDEPFLDPEYMAYEMSRTGKGVFTADFVYTLGEDEYFCMGDNRIVSADSRIYGPFLKDEIVAKGLFVIWPFDSFGTAE